jgi:hypothetical protein
MSGTTDKPVLEQDGPRFNRTSSKYHIELEVVIASTPRVSFFCFPSRLAWNFHVHLIGNTLPGREGVMTEPIIGKLTFPGLEIVLDRCRIWRVIGADPELGWFLERHLNRKYPGSRWFGPVAGSPGYRALHELHHRWGGVLEIAPNINPQKRSDGLDLPPLPNNPN